VYSFLDFYSDIGIFGVYAGTDSKQLNSVSELLYQELLRVTQKPLSDGILTKIKNQLKGNLVLGLEGTSRRMSRLAKNELYFGQYVSIDDLIYCIDRVTSEDIYRVANKIVQPEKFITVVFQSSN